MIESIVWHSFVCRLGWVKIEVEIAVFVILNSKEREREIRKAEELGKEGKYSIFPTFVASTTVSLPCKHMNQ